MNRSLPCFLLASLLMSAFPCAAAEKGDEPVAWLYQAFMDKRDPEAVWTYYLEHRATIDKVVPAKNEEGSTATYLGLRYLCEVAVRLGKPETAALLDVYQDAIDRHQKYFPDVDLDPEIMSRLWEAGNYELATKAFARCRMRQDERRKGIQRELQKIKIHVKDPALLKGNELRTQLASSSELQFMKFIGDWRAVDRNYEILSGMGESLSKWMGGEYSIFFAPEMWLPIRAEYAYRAGKIELAEEKVSAFLKAEKTFQAKARKDGSLGPVDGPGGEYRVLFETSPRYRIRIIACNIALDRGQIEKASALLKELGPLAGELNRALAVLAAKGADKKKPAIPPGLEARMELADLQARVDMAASRFDEVVARANAMLVETAELPELSPTRLLARQRLAWALVYAKRHDEAAKEIAAIKEIQLKLLSGLFASGSERQKLIYLQHADPFSLAAAIGDPARVADLLVKIKGSVLDSLIAGRQSLAKAGNDTERKLLRQINEASRALTEASLGGSGDVEARQRDLEILQSKVAQRAAASTGSPLSTSVEAVVARLNPGEALCDFVRYRLPDGKGGWAWQYGTVILRPDRSPAWIALGDAEKIDVQIAGLLGDQRFLPSEAEMRSRLRALYDTLMAPLDKALADSRRLIVSPDSALTQLSFAVLLDKDQRFLSETRQIVYVTSARDLLAGDTQSWEGGEALIVADPDYAAASGKKPRKIDPALMALSLPFDTGHLPAANRLEATGTERDLVSKTLGAMGCKTEALSGANATEEKLAACLAKAPAVLHFATHGFVLDATRATMSGLSATGKIADLVPKAPSFAPEPRKATPMAPPSPLESSPPLVVDQPLERAMLALAGAQNTLTGWKAGELRDPASDGFLSAAEVASLDLRTNFLTVLSACDTAVGDPIAGQGVLGLRRGFFMAGADHLMMTFWSLDDEQAPGILNGFYEELAKERHPALALAKVQGKILKSSEPGAFGGLPFVRAVFVAGALGMSSTGKLPPLP